MVPSEIIALFLLEQSSKQLRSRRREAGVDLNERVSREVQGDCNPKQSQNRHLTKPKPNDDRRIHGQT